MGGTRYVVTESVEQVVAEVRDFRAAVISAADFVQHSPSQRASLHAVPDSDV